MNGALRVQRAAGLLLAGCLLATGVAAANPEDEALATVQAFMDALGKRDTAALSDLLLPEGQLVGVQDDGSVRFLAHADYLRSLENGSGELHEVIFDTSVRVLGNFASVWAPYNFYLDGRLHHCGANNFSLVRHADRWRVAAVAYSSLADSCAPRDAGGSGRPRSEK